MSSSEKKSKSANRQRRYSAALILLSTLFVISALLSYIIDIKGLTYPIFFIQSQMENAITPSSGCIPKLERDKSEGRFYKFSNSRFRFYAYSAFYDDRPSLQSDPVIRIIAISDDFDKFKTDISDFKMVCVLTHLHGTTRAMMEEKPLDCGQRYSWNGYDAKPYVYTCPTNGTVPYFLQIETTIDESPVTSCMPIEYPPKRRKPKRFGVCVPVSYGNDFDPYHVIEWLELQRMLGVSLLSVYDLYLGSDARQVFQSYAEIDGFVQLRKMDRVYPFEHNAHILELAVSLNDCLYRNMYSVKRIIVSDIDEFIRPLKHLNLAELVGFLESTLTFNLSVNYLIRNNYYFLELQPDTNISRYFKILGYRKKTDVSPPFHRVKPIIVTMSCTHMFSHLCLGSTANYSDRELNESIDPEVAVNVHHRVCPLTSEECADAMANVTQDDSMLVYYDVLRARVRRKIKAVMGRVPEDL